MPPINIPPIGFSALSRPKWVKREMGIRIMIDTTLTSIGLEISLGLVFILQSVMAGTKAGQYFSFASRVTRHGSVSLVTRHSSLIFPSILFFQYPGIASPNVTDSAPSNTKVSRLGKPSGFPIRISRMSLSRISSGADPFDRKRNRSRRRRARPQGESFALKVLLALPVIMGGSFPVYGVFLT